MKRSHAFAFQEELTSKDLFHTVYGKKIMRDFKEGKLDDDGNPVEPSDSERQTRDEAWVREETGIRSLIGPNSVPSREAEYETNGYFG